MLKIKYICVCLLMLAPIGAMAANNLSGHKIYQRQCAICHGQNGISSMASAPSFKRGEGLFKPDFALLAHLQKGKNACPSFQGMLREKEMFDVIAYIRTLYP